MVRMMSERILLIGDAQRELQPAYELLMDSLELRQRIGDREGVVWCLESFAELGAADG